MKDFFNLGRFWALLKMVLFEKRMQLLGFFVGITVLINLAYFTLDVNSISEHGQNLGIVLVLLFGPLLISFIISSYFSSKRSSVLFLSLPVSYFERWLLYFVVAYLIYIPVVICIFMLSDYYYVHNLRLEAIKELKMNKNFVQKNLAYLQIQDFGISAKSYWRASLILFAISILVKLFAKKFTELKFILVTVGFLCVVTFFMNFLLDSLIDRKSSMLINDLGSMMAPIGETSYTLVTASPTVHTFVGVFMNILLPLALCLIALVRIKEKEL